MNSYATVGIVIKRSNLGEADKLITIFTRSHGKVTLVAKGLRKLSSKRAGSMELFNHVKASIIKGRGGLDTLAEVQTINSFPTWRKHLGRVVLAYQLVEIVDKLTPDHQPHPEIYEILKQALSQISGFGSDWKFKIENLKLQIIRELGFWPRHKEYSGDINLLIEEIANRPYHSPKLLNKLK